MKADGPPKVGNLHTKHQLGSLRRLLRWHPVTKGFPQLAEVVTMSCLESRSSHDTEAVLLRRFCQEVVLEVPCTRAEDQVVAGTT